MRCRRNTRWNFRAVLGHQQRARRGTPVTGRHGQARSAILVHEGGRVNAERSLGWDGGGCCAEEGHGGDGSEEDEGIAGVGLIDDVAEETA